MSKLGVHVCELSDAELMVMARRLRAARDKEGGLGPTEDSLLRRFTLMLPVDKADAVVKEGLHSFDNPFKDV